MANATGFGKPKQTKQLSKSSVKRSQAAQQYDKMKSDGMPEFNIFIRVKNTKNWFPVGSLAVGRTNQIQRAIFDQEAELRQGAFRLFPVLKKNQAQLEYGYRLKQYTDEPIQLAERPQPIVPSALQTTLQTALETAKGTLDTAKEKVTGLLRRSR